MHSSIITIQKTCDYPTQKDQGKEQPSNWIMQFKECSVTVHYTHIPLSLYTEQSYEGHSCCQTVKLYVYGVHVMELE